MHTRTHARAHTHTHTEKYQNKNTDLNVEKAHEKHKVLSDSPLLMTVYFSNEEGTGLYFTMQYTKLSKTAFQVKQAYLKTGII